LRYIRVHVAPGPDKPPDTLGTQDTCKIRRRSSNGCTGAYDEHIAELFGLSRIGTQVLLI
jgi:hypothetical protein